MNIDFHHGVIFVLSRLAGFDDVEAGIIADSSQYVDDATDSGTASFATKQLYHFKSSAHKNLDYRNFKKLQNHLVWIPFHFLPSNEYDPSCPHVPEFIQRITTRPNSHVAADMMANLCKRLKDDNFLFQLGIALHVYADTWAHQRFCGVNHKANEVEKILHASEGHYYHRKRHEYYARHLKHFHRASYWKYSHGPRRKIWDLILSKIISDALPLGHGALLSYPDRPYLTFEYIDGYGRKVKRNNTEIFMDAARHIWMWLYAIKQGERPEGLGWSPRNFSENDIPDRLKKDFQLIEENFSSFTEEDEIKRYEKWTEKIRAGEFSFGAGDIVSHTPEGRGSWVDLALGVSNERDIDENSFKFDQKFFSSHWKSFRDAMEAHRTSVIHELLPTHGLCIA